MPATWKDALPSVRRAARRPVRGGPFAARPPIAAALLAAAGSLVDLSGTAEAAPFPIESPVAVEVTSPVEGCAWSGRSDDAPLAVSVSVPPEAAARPADLDALLACAPERNLLPVIRLDPPADWQRAADPYAAVASWIGDVERLLVAHRGKLRVLLLGHEPEARFEPSAYAFLVEKVGTILRSVDPEAILVLGTLGPAADPWLAQIPPARLLPYVGAVALEDSEEAAARVRRLALDYPGLPAWIRVRGRGEAAAVLASILKARGAGAAVAAVAVEEADPAAAGALQRFIHAVPARFVPDPDPLVVAIHGAGDDEAVAAAAEPIGLLADPLGPERALFLAPGGGGRLRLSIGPDRIGSVRAIDLGTGAAPGAVVRQAGEGGGATLVDLAGVAGPALIRFVVERGPRSAPETVGVVAEYELTAEEVIARQRAFEAAQARTLSHYAAKATLSYHYRAEALNEAIDVASVNRFFWRAGVAEYEEKELYINGARWKGRAPSLPFIQAEKVKEVPLEIRLDASYRYALAGRDEVRGRPCYVLDFEPEDRTRSLYSGRVWIDAATFARHRVRFIQHGLKEPITSNSDEIEYGAVPGPERTHWLPVRGYRQMVFTVLGRTVAVERIVAYEGFSVNGPDFDAVREQAYAAGKPILREDGDGYAYLVLGEDGVRERPAESLENVALVGGVSFGPDGVGAPFAAVNYFDFDWRGTGTQLDVAFAGPFVNVSWTDPALLGSRWELTLEGRFVGLRDRLKRVQDIGRVDSEDVKVLEEPVTAILGRPLTSFSKVELGLGAVYEAYDRSKRTDARMVLPSDVVTGTAGLRYKYHRAGFLLDLQFTSAKRFGWEDWGLPRGGGGRAGEDHHQIWSASLIKSLYPGRLHKLSLGTTFAAGRDLDRFSRIRIGEFRSVRVRGYNGAEITFDRGLTASATYLVTPPAGGFSVDLNVDGALIENEEDFGARPAQPPASTYRDRDHVEPDGIRERLAGIGVGVTWSGPWGTLMTLRGAWGLGASIDVPGSSASFRLVTVKTFDRWPFGPGRGRPRP